MSTVSSLTVQRLCGEKGGFDSRISKEEAFKQALTKIALSFEWVSKYSGSILTVLEGNTNYRENNCTVTDQAN